VKKIPGLSEEQNLEIARAYVASSQAAFYEDVAIWDSKTRIDNMLLCEGDGPLYQARNWYNQFYVDTADVNPSARERMAFELNISDVTDMPKLHHVFEH
jgi:3-ketosteroid 9alpha-monooxygenase subunit A